jgi:hypothetical protein
MIFICSGRTPPDIDIRDAGMTVWAGRRVETCSIMSEDDEVFQ